MVSTSADVLFSLLELSGDLTQLGYNYESQTYHSHLESLLRPRGGLRSTPLISELTSFACAVSFTARPRCQPAARDLGISDHPARRASASLLHQLSANGGHSSTLAALANRVTHVYFHFTDNILYKDHLSTTSAAAGWGEHGECGSIG